MPAGRPKGIPKSGGRQKGTPNKFTAQANEIAARLGIEPLEILFRFAAGDWKGLGYENEIYHSEGANGETKLGYVIKPEVRAKAAAEACQYLYPKRKAVELSNAYGESGGFKIIVEDYRTKK